jgi:peptidoglycan/LPS O-acetylase OafA/YrhL
LPRNPAALGSATFFVPIYLQHAYDPRYAYMASALVVCPLVFGAALLGRGARSQPATGRGIDRLTWWAARLALPVAAFVLAVGFARSFWIETRSSNGPDVPAEYVVAAPSCAAGATSIRLAISPINADAWAIEIPCDRVVASL